MWSDGIRDSERSGEGAGLEGWREKHNVVISGCGGGGGGRTRGLASIPGAGFIF